MWQALPWWQTRLYLEGLNHEFPASAEPDGPADQVVSLESLGVAWS